MKSVGGAVLEIQLGLCGRDQAVRQVSRIGIQTAKVQGKLPYKYLESGDIKIMKVQRAIAKL
jgi:hypothetical protein